jgi:hypothetical protein
VIILAANGYFLLSWCKQVLPLLIEAIRRKFAKLSKNYRISPIIRKSIKSEDLSGFSGESKGTRVLGQEFDQSEASISPPSITPVSGQVPENSPCSVEQSQADQASVVPENSIDWS